MCEAADLPVHFGVFVVVVKFFPLFGQSWLRCPNNLRLKHLPSFMRRVRSLIVIAVDVHGVGVLLFREGESLLCRKCTGGIRWFVVSFLKKLLRPLVSDVKICGLCIPLLKHLRGMF
jgi:hypothetical protein